MIVRLNFSKHFNDFHKGLRKVVCRSHCVVHPINNCVVYIAPEYLLFMPDYTMSLCSVNTRSLSDTANMLDRLEPIYCLLSDKAMLTASTAADPEEACMHRRNVGNNINTIYIGKIMLMLYCVQTIL